MEKHYPKWKYHQDYEAVTVEHEQEEKELGAGWVDSPAEFGVETCKAAPVDPDKGKKIKKKVKP